MAQFLVLNLKGVVKERIERCAKRHGRSTEEEVRGIGLDGEIAQLREQPAWPAL